MGFHPEFTGRQNAWMSGQLLGLSAKDVSDAMPAVEAFAEVGTYFDQPLRVYSSGMQVRLAFSVATAVRPDVLIVDEALSVGDTYFQHKCTARMRWFRDQGTTMLLVSHDPTAVKSLCDRAVLLDHGKVVKDDAPDRVLDYYNAIIARREVGVQNPRGGGECGIASIDALGRRAGHDRVGRPRRPEGGSMRALRSNAPVKIRVAFDVHASLPSMTVGFLIRDRLGNDVFGTNTHHLGITELRWRPASGLHASSKSTGCRSVPAITALRSRCMKRTRTSRGTVTGGSRRWYSKSCRTTSRIGSAWRTCRCDAGDPRR
jgi:lipopolysaccharide transport system ATP-binding protein